MEGIMTQILQRIWRNETKTESGKTYGYKYQRLTAIKAKYDPQTSSTATPTSSQRYRNRYRVRLGFPPTPTAQSAS